MQDLVFFLILKLIYEGRQGGFGGFPPEKNRRRHRGFGGVPRYFETRLSYQNFCRDFYLGKGKF